MYEGGDGQSLPRVLFGMSPGGLQWNRSRADTVVWQICIYIANSSGFFFAFSRTET